MTVFLLLAEQKDHGFEVAYTSSEGRAFDSDSESDAVPYQEGPRTLDQLDAVSSLPTPSDILVSYSTFPGELIRAAAPSPGQLCPEVVFLPGTACGVFSRSFTSPWRPLRVK